MQLEKYTDKKILILGGGTSTLDSKWENLDYDYVWTCNEFFMEPRVLSQSIDLYLLSYTVDLNDERLYSKLQESDTTVIIEGHHYRGKQHSNDFKSFLDKIKIPVYNLELPTPLKKESAANFAGAAFRLILTALNTSANTIYFAGFDGFNKEFSNIHAFTKHPGLKTTDTRRTYEGTRESYVNVFTEAYKWFMHFSNYKVLQNLGEGFDYNIGTHISKEYFPLTEEVYEKIR